MAETDVAEPSAVCLATADAAGRPSARTVLLKGWDADGFVFYTNLGSRKARQLAENPRAALSFWWPPLLEQAHVEGGVERVTDTEADAYWATRPRESRVGAWASRQSETLSGRDELERRFAEAEARFAGADVPRPEFWSGYRLLPERIELWTSRPHRLHDRELWELGPDGWSSRRLFP
jgi:pyridoxamine 5'-phosphate oxidase